MIYDLPTAVEIGGVSYAIRSDYRAILDIFCALGDPGLTPEDKTVITVEIFYVDVPPLDAWKEALEKCFWFLDGGKERDKSPARPKLMDWEQDFQYICSAINSRNGMEVRAVPYMHWWTFVGYYMGIGDSAFAEIVAIRKKLRKHKKLEKYEEEFYRENPDAVNIRTRYTEEEDALLKKLLKG